MSSIEKTGEITDLRRFWSRRTTRTPEILASHPNDYFCWMSPVQMHRWTPFVPAGAHAETSKRAANDATTTPERGPPSGSERKTAPRPLLVPHRATCGQRSTYSHTQASSTPPSRFTCRRASQQTLTAPADHTTLPAAAATSDGALSGSCDLAHATLEQQLLRWQRL